MMKTVQLVAIAFLTIAFFGCGEGKTMEVTSEELKKRWIESEQHSAESWWYAGDRDERHVFVVKRTFSKTVLEVPIKDATLRVDRFPYTEKSKSWTNLKSDDLVFD